MNNNQTANSEDISQYKKKIEKKSTELNAFKQRLKKVDEESDYDIKQLERQIKDMRDGCVKNDADILKIIDEKEMLIREYRAKQANFHEECNQYIKNESKEISDANEKLNNILKKSGDKNGNR
jgi:uncharacterized coiled-coil protein SlyX